MATSSNSTNRKDPAWNYATLINPDDTNKVKCNFCGKVTSGGIYRHKQHLVGGSRNARTCPKCPEHVKEEISGFMQKKKEVRSQMDAIPHFDDIAEDDEQWEVERETKASGKRPISLSRPASAQVQLKKSKQLGPIDLFFTQDADEVVKQRKKEKMNPKQFDECKKKMREYAVQKFARWMYDAGIPFNAVKYDSFGPAIEAIGQYGSGMKPPTYHEMRVTYLKKELEHTNTILKGHEQERAKYGCTLMADGWTDRKGRSLINFLVNSPRGSVFIESVDASGYSHTGDKMFELLDMYVQRVGEHNVVQIVTDSASANVAAGKLLEAKYSHLYWAPCAAHCLDLMFEDIFKISNLKRTFERAVSVNGYMYNRAQVLNMMREFTSQKEMVRPAKTRFATAFLTLDRFHKQKANLKKMFTSEKWTSSKFAKELQGRKVANIILSPSFWNNIIYAVKLAGPLVAVLRLVDGEKKPPMGYIYEAMDRAKEQIVYSFNNNEEKYKHIFKIVDTRWSIQLHRPLHSAGHFLNPEYFYANPRIEQDEEIINGLYDCIARLVPNVAMQDLITQQLTLYKKAEGVFGKSMAIRQRSSLAPATWWELYGSSAPNLQTFAIKVLSLTCSSSGCERNWSVFEYIHSKRRSRLEQQRLNDLVYIKYNRALMRRHDMRDTIDPISLDQIDESNEWLLGTVEKDDGDTAVFDDGDDDLTWGDVARATGAEEPAYNLKSRVTSSKGKNKIYTPSASSSHRLVNEEDEINIDDINEDEDEEDNEQYKSDDSGGARDNSDSDDFIDLDN